MPELSTVKAGNHDMHRLLSTRQAADYLGVSTSTVRHLIYSGDLPVLRCFKYWRLDRSDLDAFIRRNKDVL